MKTVRSNKYRRKRRRSDGTKLAMILAIIGGAVIVAAAIVVLIFVLFFTSRSAEEVTQVTVSQVESDTSSADSQDSAITDEIAKINPNAATAKTIGKKAYQSLFPEMYVPIVEKIPAEEGANVVYLTFDDGPSSLTEKLLDVLDKQKVKATFFVSCQGEVTDETLTLIKEIADRGHAIGIHSYSHDYDEIYQSVEAYLTDFSKMNDIIYEATGQKPTMFRFAGGSYNSYNKKVYKAIIAEMERRGYTYFDWNVDSGDSESDATEKSIYQTTIDGITSNNKSIVLMHNSASKKYTVNQVAAIIKKAKKEGYHFELLDPSVKPFSFAYPET